VAKNRFSNQRRSNYCSGYKYGINYRPAGDKGRKPLTEEAVKWLRNLLKRTTNKEDRDFIISIGKRGKMPTPRQKEVLIRIMKYE
tara:strand:+ start:8410 stop:8664 length:255 start_codon:yes stop_codon:yes gene_type:complete